MEIEIYWIKEIGESDWEECEKQKYDNAQKSPLFDTKITVDFVDELESKQ